MIVSFGSKLLRDLGASLLEAERQLGLTDPGAIRSLLADMEAADNAAEFIELFGHDATVEQDRIRMKVGTRHEASFVIVGTRHKILEDGRPAWSTVTRLKMTEISS